MQGARQAGARRPALQEPAARAEAARALAGRRAPGRATCPCGPGCSYRRAQQPRRRSRTGRADTARAAPRPLSCRSRSQPQHGTHPPARRPSKAPRDRHLPAEELAVVIRDLKLQRLHQLRRPLRCRSKLPCLLTRWVGRLPPGWAAKTGGGGGARPPEAPPQQAVLAAGAGARVTSGVEAANRDCRPARRLGHHAMRSQHHARPRRRRQRPGALLPLPNRRRERHPPAPSTARSPDAVAGCVGGWVGVGGDRHMRTRRPGFRRPAGQHGLRPDFEEHPAPDGISGLHLVRGSARPGTAARPGSAGWPPGSADRPGRWRSHRPETRHGGRHPGQRRLPWRAGEGDARRMEPGAHRQAHHVDARSHEGRPPPSPTASAAPPTTICSGALMLAMVMPTSPATTASTRRRSARDRHQRARIDPGGRRQRQAAWQPPAAANATSSRHPAARSAGNSPKLWPMAPARAEPLGGEDVMHPHAERAHRRLGVERRGELLALGGQAVRPAARQREHHGVAARLPGPRQRRVSALRRHGERPNGRLRAARPSPTYCEPWPLNIATSPPRDGRLRASPHPARRCLAPPPSSRACNPFPSAPPPQRGPARRP